MQLQRSEKRRDVNISRALQWGPGSTACHKVGCPSQPKVYGIYLLHSQPKVYKYIFTPSVHDILSPSGAKSLIVFAVLALACLAGFSSRLFAVIRSTFISAFPGQNYQ